ncbi:MAG TPA: hydrolase 1, exosortase A system-associated [Burkholderiales bacterium]|nr:hydrolase 1, exosortase A system-associated [Burkholderiales bacterium]
MTYEEKAFVFGCNESSLIGIAAIPEKPFQTGVLIVVGGPQYRIGSHRQFLLLSRDLAESGIPCMRFDYRGMGDSEGDQRNFEEVEEDINSAVDAFFDRCPEMKKVILWGLCDAASASVFYAHQDPRISGLVLLNPWVRTVESEAKARLKHYYLSRIFDAAFWKKLLSGKLEFGKSLKDFSGSVSSLGKNEDSGENLPLPERLRKSLERFDGKILLILSGNDLTAREFEDLANSPQWASLAERMERMDLPDADHTFSRRQWRDRVSSWTKSWVSAMNEA